MILLVVALYLDKNVGLSISLSRSHEKHKDVFNFLLYMDGCVRCFHSMHGLPEGSRI